MGREFTPAVGAVVARRSNPKYYAAFHVTLPMGPGDVERPVLRVAEADLLLPSLVTLRSLTIDAFRGALRRNPTLAEYNAWQATLEAALLVSAQQVADDAGNLIEGLFNSAEYAARNTTDDRFVTELYLAFMARAPEIGGKGFWIADIISSGGRAHAIDAFRLSIEFGNRARSANQLQFYKKHVAKTPALSAFVLSDGAANDDVSVSLINLGDAYSNYLGQSDRILHPAHVVAMRAYPVGAGVYEADVIFPGFATFGDINQSTAKLNVISDTSQESAQVGTVETIRCPLNYKGEGCDTNDPSPTCSRLFVDANGCSSKQPALVLIGAANNQPSFGGGPDKAASLAGAQPAPAGGGGVIVGGGFGTDGHIDPDDPRLQRAGSFTAMRDVFNVA